MTIAKQLSRMSAADASEKANELCGESDRIQNWENGVTTWKFDDGSHLQVSGQFVKALSDIEIAELDE